MISKTLLGLLCCTVFLFVLVNLSLAEIKIIDKQDYSLSITPYLRTDIVTLKNTIDLDSKNSDDTTTYFGIDYSIGFDLKSKESGPQAFIKLERNGPYDYDAPLFIHNTLRTSTDRVERYRGKQLWPQVEEFWADVPVSNFPFRFKSGLFAYNVGNGIASGGSYENYGLSLYNEDKDIKWHFYYCKPDLANKTYLGPHIKQEREQGIDYEHNKANFFAADVKFPLSDKNTLRPICSYY